MLFIDRPLARTLEATCARVGAALVQAHRTIDRAAPIQIDNLGGDEGSARLLFDGPGSPLNGAIAVGHDGAVDDMMMDWIEVFFRARAAAPRLAVSPLADHTVVEQVSKRGYRLVGFEHVYVRSLDVWAPRFAPRVTAFDMVRIEDGQTAIKWAEMMALAWSDGDEPDDAHRRLAARLPNTPGVYRYGAVIRDIPVAGGLLGRHEESGYFFGFAIHKKHSHNTAIEEGILDLALRQAREMGLSEVIMRVPPAGPSQRNAERAGFRLAYTSALMEGPVEKP
jgi:hypothetical protein